MSWTRPNHSIAIVLSSALILGAACGGRQSEQLGSTDPTDPTLAGSVGLKLSLPGSIHLDKLDWLVRDGEGQAVLSSQNHAPGPIRIPDSGYRGVAFQIGGIPAGHGYTITLSGTDSHGDSCLGTSDPFDIIAGKTSGTAINVVCGFSPDAGLSSGPVTTGSVFVDAGVTLQELDAGSVTCPAITELSASPLVTVVHGEPVRLNAVTSGPDAIFTWTQSAPIGLLSNTASPTPIFTCTAAGSATLTLTVSLPGVPACATQPSATMSTVVSCEPPSPVDYPLEPGMPCTANAECAGFNCINEICGAYAPSCAVLSQRGAPPAEYRIATDSVPGKPYFEAFCPTGSPWLAPVGIAQAEPGAPPATRSFVGAVGYDFNGVDFGGTMKDGGLLNWQGQPVGAQQDVLELADGSLLTTSAWAWWNGSDTAIRSYPIVGTPSATISLPSPQGMVELFDRSVLVGGSGVYVVTKAGTNPVLFDGAGASFPIQLVSGTILLPASSVNEMIRRNPDGTLIGSISDPSFTAASLTSALQLPDGTIVIGESGRIKFFAADLSPRVFTSAPSGMTLNSDGSLTRVPEMSGTGALLQLPNGQILFSMNGAGTIIRLNADGSYVDTYTLPSNYGSAIGITLDHHGRLLVSLVSAHVVDVVTFPGCSDMTRNGSETDIDCGGTCTVKCKTSQTCSVNGDCVSGVCRNTVCQ